MDLTAHTSLSPIRRGFAPSFVNYKNGCTRLAVASDKVYQLFAHGQWFSPGTPASSTAKTGRHDTAEIVLKVALNTINQSVNHLIKLKLRIYHTVETVPKSNIKVVKRGNIGTPNTQIHNQSLSSWLGAGTSIQKWRGSACCMYSILPY